MNFHKVTNNSIESSSDCSTELLVFFCDNSVTFHFVLLLYFDIVIMYDLG